MTYNTSMTQSFWTVEHIGQAKRALKNISNFLSADARKSYAFLLGELRNLGPQRHNWPNFSKIGKDGEYHCHIEKGRPTYVVCWKANKKEKIIEVYYVGTHEKAPY